MIGDATCMAIAFSPDLNEDNSMEERGGGGQGNDGKCETNGWIEM